MSQKRLWIAAGIIAVVIFSGFAISVPHTVRDLVEKTEVTAPKSTPVVLVKDSYKKGVHTVSGSVTAPNACHTLVASGAHMGNASTTEYIALSLTLTDSQGGVCLELPTILKFSTTVTAPQGIPITATVNGETASTTAS